MKKMYNLHDVIDMRVNVYVIKFPTHDLTLQDSGKFVTMFQRISVFHILFFHNTCIPYMIGEITFILICEASKKINYFECKGEKCVSYIHLKKTKR